jgi:2-polyprenyl-3-methyl-5-hydroxy-6-metoxy-1,4-benzoquinol methylase
MRSIEAECSVFVVEAIRSMGRTSGLALDIPSGEGRHSRLLASCGMRVISADLDIKALTRGVAAASRFSRRISAVRLDATKPLPFKEGAFDLVLIAHFHLRDFLPLVERLVKSGGLLILETYGGHGENWRSLPLVGEVSAQLSGEFHLMQYKESPVRKQPERVTVKAVGRKRFDYRLR